MTNLLQPDFLTIFDPRFNVNTFHILKDVFLFPDVESLQKGKEIVISCYGKKWWWRQEWLTIRINLLSGINYDYDDENVDPIHKNTYLEVQIKTKQPYYYFEVDSLNVGDSRKIIVNYGQLLLVMQALEQSYTEQSYTDSASGEDISIIKARLANLIRLKRLKDLLETYG